MSILSDNKVLKAAEARVESGLTPDTRRDYEKIVTAGLQFGLHNGREGVLAALKNRTDPLRDCAIGAVNTVRLLSMQARGTMPPKAMIPASMALMLQALEFADTAKIIRVGRDELAQATKAWTDAIFQLFGVNANSLDRYAGMVKRVTDDPTQMEMINRRTGYLKDPRASTPISTPTEMPAADPEPRLNRAARRRRNRRGRR